VSAVAASENVSETGGDSPTDGYYEIYALKPEIVDYINTGFQEDLSLPVSNTAVDMSKAIKIYVDTNIFAIDANDIDTIKQTLDEGIYMYEVPVYVGSDTYIANISKRIPLTDEDKSLLTESEIAQHESRAGMWVVSGVIQIKGETVDYAQFVETAVPDFAGTPIFVGGLPYFRYAVAILNGSDGAVDKIVPLNFNSVDWGALGFEPQDGQVSFDYTSIKSIVNSIESQSSSTTINDRTITVGVITIGLIVTILGLAIAFLYHSRNRSHR
jgi:hypothetical protein